MKPSVTNEAPVTCTECVNCGAEAWGYSLKDLLYEGWTAHTTKSGQVYLCGDCVPVFEGRRREHP